MGVYIAGTGGWGVVSSWVTRVVCLLTLVLGFGVLAVTSTPEGGTAIGIWPVGGATACLLVSARPRTSVLMAVIAAIAVGSIWVGGRDPDVALGLGLGIAASVWVMWRVFTGGERVRPDLRTTSDLNRYVAGAALGAFVAGAVAFATSVATGWGDPPRLTLAIVAANLASQLTVVPFFARLRPRASAAGAIERAVQWLVIVTLTPLVFVPHDFPSIVFMLVPVLTWCALRTAPHETLAQMVVVLMVAITLTTYGRGPFADAGARYGLSDDAQGVLLSTFIVVCAFVVVPLMLAVGEQLENARQVSAERD
jgi:integral membrane sensor domain MASE1